MAKTVKKIKFDLVSDDLGSSNVLHRKDVPKDLQTIKQVVIDTFYQTHKEALVLGAKLESNCNTIEAGLKRAKGTLDSLQDTIVDLDVYTNSLQDAIAELAKIQALLAEAILNHTHSYPWYDYILRPWIWLNPFKKK